jgi:hypothetical protein
LIRHGGDHPDVLSAKYKKEDVSYTVNPYYPPKPRLWRGMEHGQFPTNPEIQDEWVLSIEDPKQRLENLIQNQTADFNQVLAGESASIAKVKANAEDETFTDLALALARVSHLCAFALSSLRGLTDFPYGIRETAHSANHTSPSV